MSRELSGHRHAGRRILRLCLALSFTVGCAAGSAERGPSTAISTGDYRSRMRSVDVAAAFEAAGKPDVSLLPTGAEWVAHVQQDLLQFWTTPPALGSPIGNFPTFRANDGSLIDPKHPPPEITRIAATETWLLGRVGRQYTRTMSRQIFAYSVAYHMTGDERYLRYARLGMDYMFTKMVDRDGIFYSWMENGVPGPANARQRTSQDLASALVGPAMNYYITRDPSVLGVIRRTEKYIFENYREGNALRWVNEPLVDLEETHLPTRKELAAQLDQIYAYMLLVTTVLEEPERNAWLDKMLMLTRTIKDDYYDQERNQFWGRIDGAENRTPGEPNVFGNTIKVFWLLLETGLRFDKPELRDFALANMPPVFREAYSKAYGTWIEKKLADGAIGTDRVWWLHDELDQGAAILSLTDSSYLRYLIPTYRYWFFDFVDSQGKEVWHGLTGEAGKPAQPMFLKAHLWKNAFHVFEHALIGYITSQAVRGEPVRLYYAFAHEPERALIHPYVMAATISRYEPTQQRLFDGTQKVAVEFTGVTP